MEKVNIKAIKLLTSSGGGRGIFFLAYASQERTKIRFFPYEYVEYFGF